VTVDPNRHPENGDGERVVVRDRRRVDPDTGEVRTPDGEQPSGATIPTPGVVADDPRVAELTAEVAERTADLQRLSAEYANYRRRVDRDRETVLVNTRAQFVGELLTVLDDVERAGAHGDLTGPFKSVADKLVSVVQKLGLEPFGTEGEPFDPSVHEAVQHETADATGPTVTGPVRGAAPRLPHRRPRPAARDGGRDGAGRRRNGDRDPARGDPGRRPRRPDGLNGDGVRRREAE
jgi:molecular chaperone GrpE